MQRSRVSGANVMKFAGAFMAYLMGAGFATGQEVLQYFAAYGYEGFLTVSFVFVCFVYAGGELITAGYTEHFANKNDIYKYYCGKYIGVFYDYFSVAFIYMSYIVMLGGAGATFSQYYHLPQTAGAVLVMLLSYATVVCGLGRIVDIIGTIGPLIVTAVICAGLGAVVTNPSGMADGCALLSSGALEVTKVGSNWLMSGMSYVGFCMLWLASFLPAVGTEANSKKEAALGILLGAAGFAAGAAVLMSGLLACFKDIYVSDIPSLVLAEKIWPPFASFFSVIIMAGIYTASVPLLWGASARFAHERTKKFYGLTAALAAAACFIALKLPFRQIVNIIYGINGYVGVLLIFFMLRLRLGVGGRSRRNVE